LKIPTKQKRNFWAREMKALNDLLNTFDNTEFWQRVKFDFKPNSLLFFKAGDGKLLLRKKYNEFNYKILKPDPQIIGKMVGENRLYKRQPKTIKDFLNE
jgi:hypothetical protein